MMIARHSGLLWMVSPTIVPPHFSIQISKGSVRVLKPEPSLNGGFAINSWRASEAGTNNDSLNAGGGPEVGSRRDIKEGIAGVRSLGIWCSANGFQKLDSDLSTLQVSRASKPQNIVGQTQIVVKEV